MCELVHFFVGVNGQLTFRSAPALFGSDVGAYYYLTTINNPNVATAMLVMQGLNFRAGLWVLRII